MQRFADLYAQLDETRATSVKLVAMRDYFAQTPPQDAAWGLYFLLGHRLKRLIPASRLRLWVGEFTGLSPALIEESYAHVGDLAETIALLVDKPTEAQPDDTGLADWVARLLHLKAASEDEQKTQLFAWWQRLPRKTGAAHGWTIGIVGPVISGMTYAIWCAYASSVRRRRCCSRRARPFLRARTSSCVY